MIGGVKATFLFDESKRMKQLMDVGMYQDEIF